MSASRSRMGIAWPSAISVWFPLVLSSERYRLAWSMHASARPWSRANRTVCMVPPLTSVSMTRTPSDNPLCIRLRSANADRTGLVSHGVFASQATSVLQHPLREPAVGRWVDLVKAMRQHHDADATPFQTAFMGMRVASVGEAAHDYEPRFRRNPSRSLCDLPPVRRGLARSHDCQPPRRVKPFLASLHEQHSRRIGRHSKTRRIPIVMIRERPNPEFPASLQLILALLPGVGQLDRPHRIQIGPGHAVHQLIAAALGAGLDHRCFDDLQGLHSPHTLSASSAREERSCSSTPARPWAQQTDFVSMRIPLRLFVPGLGDRYSKGSGNNQGAVIGGFLNWRSGLRPNRSACG